MDLSTTLIRSVTRAFYPPEQVIIMDAVLMHSAVRDDNLALMLGQQPKHTRKECFKLVDDGILASATRPEIREGSTRPFNQAYFYVDPHRAIDSIKFKIKSMQRVIHKKYGQTVEEKKEYSCPRCKSSYTQMDVLDLMDNIGNFLCKRCRHALQRAEDDGAAGSAGHEVQSRMNAQLAAFEALLPQIDATTIPEVTFDDAISRALEVKRDDSINPLTRSNPVLNRGLPPATVRGLQTAPEKIEVSVMDDKEQQEAELQEKERKRKFLEQNSLPSWHTASTVGTGPATNGVSSNSAVNGTVAKEEDEDEKKIDVQAAAEADRAQVDEDELANYFAMQEAEDNEDEDESESEDGSEEDDDDDDEKDIEAPPSKRVRIEEPPSTTSTPVNGSQMGGLDGTTDSVEESDAE